MESDKKNVDSKTQGTYRLVYDVLFLVATILLTVSTYFLYLTGKKGNDFQEQNYNAQLNIVKIEKTIELCDNFNSWYTNYRAYETDFQLVEMRNWVRNEAQWDSVNLDSVQRVNVLRKNEAVRKLFNYFEDAKMLDEEGLLHREFFFNRFYSLFLRMERAHNPPISVYINSYRKNLTDKVWDGYYYCRDLVFEMNEKIEKEKETIAK